MRAAAQQYFDRFAIGTSALCALHCVATPFLLVMIPSLASLPFEDHLVHEFLFWLVLPTSTLAVFLGCSRHKDRFVILGATLGLGLLTFTTFFGHDAFGEAGEKIAVMGAAFILAYTHVRNFRLCRKGNCAHSPAPK